jgi:outer membrane protein assembly factor BamA
VRDYTGKRVDATNADGDELKAEMGPTRLSEDCADIVGCDGGWDNYFRLGLSFDPRDFEPDPKSGGYADVALDLGTSVLGSEFDYARFLAAARFYFSPVPEVTDLVLATRGTFLAQSDGTPWFSQNTLPYTEDVRTGLGGLRTLRGYQQERFVGKVATLWNFEARWTFYRFIAAHQKFGLMVVPFIDMGRVYDEVDEISLRGWARAQGAGFRISWNLATIVSADYGVSDEDSGLYINFNHQF